MNNENARDRKIREFMSSVVRNMPLDRMGNDVLDGWNANPQAVKKVLAGFAPPATKALPKWHEKDGVIYLAPLTSDGTTGAQWIKRLEGKSWRISDWGRSVLLSSDFRPTTGVVYHPVILKGQLFSGDDRITKKIRAEAEERKFRNPHPELACLIRENYSEEDIKVMGLWWLVVMHQPIKDSEGCPLLLDVDRDNGGRWLCATDDGPVLRCRFRPGFVFLAPQELGALGSDS